jgi:glycosyltransferase involved in cell wall biosynthesis
LRALLVVDEAFAETHVGVRRVIFHYWRRLAREGYEVILVAPRDGWLERLNVSSGAIDEIESRSYSSQVELAPLVSGAGYMEAVHAGDHVMVAAPWIAPRVDPSVRISSGIVFDTIPQLVATGVLALPVRIDATTFAHEHDAGMQRLFRDRAIVSCISGSTRSDVVRFYAGLVDPGLVTVDVPFSVTGIRRPEERPPLEPDAPARVLLVNALDSRKSPVAIAGSLEIVARDRAVSVAVIGPSRLPEDEKDRVLAALRVVDPGMTWAPAASDLDLDRAYREADVLVFPSAYEGLGLPILEAQARGVPVVTTRGSSCTECARNAQLLAEGTAPPAIAAAIHKALQDDCILRGSALRGALEDWLQHVAGTWLPFAANRSAS